MPSPREDVAICLADTVAFCGLGDHHRGHFRGEGNHSWVVMFEKTGVVKGTIHVYSPHKIVIQWQSTPNKAPRKDTVSAKSEYEARQFFRQFIEGPR